MGRQEVAVYPRPIIKALELGCGLDLHEIVIAGLIFGKQDEVGGLGIQLGILLIHAPGRDIDLAAEDGLDPSLFGRVIEMKDSEHDAMIGQCQRRHAHLSGGTGQIFDLAQTVEQRKIAVDVQVNEICHGPGSPFSWGRSNYTTELPFGEG